MDEVKKKVLLDVFASPWTLLPVVGGLSAWMLSWALAGGLSTPLNLVGLAGVLGGLGMLATRLIFGLEQITEDAYTFMNEKQRQEQEAALDALDKKLRRDRDSRTQKLLRQLRHLYASFQSDAKQGRITGATHAILEKVDRLFRAAVQHLEHSYELWATAKRLPDSGRKSLLQERDEVIREVEETVDHLGRTIRQFHSFKSQDTESELQKLREELDQTLLVARRAEERVAALGKQHDYDPAEFE